MSTETIVTPAYTETEALLLNLPQGTSISTPSAYFKRAGFQAFCTWPHDALTGGESCLGQGETLAAAIDEMMNQLDLAKAKQAVLKTPAAVKRAVIDLIAEHKAAPASFRAAVDDLRVADR
jgi:hypothetical protein